MSALLPLTSLSLFSRLFTQARPRPIPTVPASHSALSPPVPSVATALPSQPSLSLFSRLFTKVPAVPASRSAAPPPPPPTVATALPSQPKSPPVALIPPLGVKKSPLLPDAAPALEVPRDRIKILSPLSSGGFSTVYRADWRGSPVAFKVTDAPCLSPLHPSIPFPLFLCR
jgi:hypothetical protein